MLPGLASVGCLRLLLPPARVQTLYTHSAAQTSAVSQRLPTSTTRPSLTVPSWQTLELKLTVDPQPPSTIRRALRLRRMAGQGDRGTYGGDRQVHDRTLLQLAGRAGGGELYFVRRVGDRGREGHAEEGQ